ncbi:MAG TPA: protein kinase [Kofleriaceae bacterium]|nr:protein kinase [Kofleriaceae bacterium]
MAGQAAEQIIAGVVLSERLAVTMYGAIHRASFGGQRNLRGLVVDPRMLEEDAFRISLTDAKNIAKLTKLEHPNIVPTMTVESGGPDVVIVTRGVGRYVTVQDLITSAKARGKQGGKLSTPVAGQIGKSVIEALAAAHRAGVIHGAVHPRSVLIGEDGNVLLADFIAGLALTTAVAQGADSSLWRGLTGYIAPELVVGEDPTPGVDVFAVGAMMFTMLSGEVPPGSLRVTPAVERLVQRALDTDPTRRYKTASDMLENLIEAMEDDRWELADRGELIKEAGLSATDENIDDATEDLLASLGKSEVKVTTPPRKDVEALGAKHQRANSTQNRLDALLADLGGGDDTGLTQVDDHPAGAAKRRDPISEVIRNERRMPVPRVPSLDDPDDEEDDATPLPPPSRGTTSADEAAALDAINDLDASGARRASSQKIEQAAKRVESEQRKPEQRKPAPRAQPIVDPIRDDDMPTPRLKSPLRSAVAGLLVLGVLGGAGYVVYTKFQEDKAREAQAKEEREKQLKEKDDIEKQLREAQADSGALDITSSGAGIWLKLGKTPLDTTIKLHADQAHDMVLLHSGNEVTEAQVNGTSWSGAKEALKAKLTVTMKPSKAKAEPVLPLQPTTPVLGSTGVVGAGIVHIESTPADAEVWLFIGANHAQFNELIAGRDYEAAVVKPGFKTQHVMFKADEWRDGGDPSTPIDVAKKKPMLSRTVELEPDPDYKPPKKGK